MIYFIILLLYLLTSLIPNLTISLIAKMIVGFSVFIFRKHFKFKIKFDFLAIFVGLIISFIWVLGHYFYNITNIEVQYKLIEFSSYKLIDILLKIITFVIFTPIIEEFFMRFWLIRFIISKDWKKVDLGKFTLPSFLFTTLFFGFSHTLWIQGIIAGILFNLVYYYKKNIESCILAHFIANLFLAIYVMLTKNTIFW